MEDDDHRDSAVFRIAFDLGESEFQWRSYFVNDMAGKLPRCSVFTCATRCSNKHCCQSLFASRPGISENLLAHTTSVSRVLGKMVSAIILRSGVMTTAWTAWQNSTVILRQLVRTVSKRLSNAEPTPAWATETGHDTRSTRERVTWTCFAYAPSQKLWWLVCFADFY